MNISESVKLAIDQIRVNKLRAFLTLLGISIGVFAIITAGSLNESITRTVSTELANIGENSFQVTKMPALQMHGPGWRKYMKRKDISYSQVTALRKDMSDKAVISSEISDGGQKVKYKNFETDPNVSLIGTDENFFVISDVKVSEGRAFVADDITLKRRVALVGTDIVRILFEHENPLGKMVKVGNRMYEIIGILESKGAILGQSQDNKMIIPIRDFLTYYTDWWTSLDIKIKAPDRQSLPLIVDDVTGAMRSIRNLKPWHENDFEIETNETISQQFMGLTGFLTFFGMLSGAFALIAAGIGIMNIMLVTVKERTREIGIRKAIGAKRKWILLQFLIEAITLCQVGSIIGTILGIATGNILAAALGLDVSVSILWIFMGAVIATALGVIFGIYPAYKASKLDPVEALRYE